MRANGLRLALALAMLLGAPATGMAQQPLTFPLRVPPNGGANGDSIQVSVSYGLNVPLKGDDETAQTEALEKARRVLYSIAASECKVLLETIAATCKLERLNVQSNVQRNPRSEDQIRVGGNASYRISLK